MSPMVTVEQSNDRDFGIKELDDYAAVQAKIEADPPVLDVSAVSSGISFGGWLSVGGAPSENVAVCVGWDSAGEKDMSQLAHLSFRMTVGKLKVNNSMAPVTVKTRHGSWNY